MVVLLRYTKDTMSELSQEYFDQHFDDLIRAVKEGFDATASKKELDEVRQELKQEIQGVNKRVSGLEFAVGQLAAEVKEFVAVVKKQDTEYVELKVKYHELEIRITKLEGLQPATAWHIFGIPVYCFQVINKGFTHRKLPWGAFLLVFIFSYVNSQPAYQARKNANSEKIKIAGIAIHSWYAPSQAHDRGSAVQTRSLCQSNDNDAKETELRIAQNRPCSFVERHGSNGIYSGYWP